jgi:hypothetical protein
MHLGTCCLTGTAAFDDVCGDEKEPRKRSKEFPAKYDATSRINSSARIDIQTPDRLRTCLRRVDQMRVASMMPGDRYQMSRVKTQLPIKVASHDHCNQDLLLYKNVDGKKIILSFIPSHSHCSPSQDTTFLPGQAHPLVRPTCN